MLDDEVFELIINSTPLISLDFIINNEQGEILLGKRINNPAKGFWFVPGGRILKNETLGVAYRRLFSEEFDIVSDIQLARFKGVYEHFYENSFFKDTVQTHYVVLAYTITANIDLSLLPRTQHTNFNWFEPKLLTSCDLVHEYTKNYFI